jgi:NAD(P)-dependent dehydrogenase (short-subunit alcohol dehydrogenase family)
MAKLNNKVIIVTGGSGLIGRHIVSKITEEGGLCINAEIEAETNLEKGTIQCDITKAGSIEQTIEMVLKKYGCIDGLVNNAYPRTNDWGTRFEDIQAESWKQNIDMQMNSVFMVCQKILPIMQQKKQGSIVNISSIYGTVGPDFGVYEGTPMTMPAAYAAVKGGVVNFTRYLASYYGKDNIRINCVSPGGIFDNQMELFVKQYEAKVPMRRMGKPQDIAPAVAFLLSEEASYITGHNLMVDGGWTAI